jgi:hypothetical protein
MPKPIPLTELQARLAVHNHLGYEAERTGDWSEWERVTGIVMDEAGWTLDEYCDVTSIEAGIGAPVWS